MTGDSSFLLFGERGCDLIGRYFGVLLDVVIPGLCNWELFQNLWTFSQH